MYCRISESKGADEASVNATIQDFVGNVGSGVSAGRSSNLVQLSLYCLGDIGSVRSMDVDMQTIANVFSSDAEDLRAAASFASAALRWGIWNPCYRRFCRSSVQVRMLESRTSFSSPSGDSHALLRKPCDDRHSFMDGEHFADSKISSTGCRGRGQKYGSRVPRQARCA